MLLLSVFLSISYGGKSFNLLCEVMKSELVESNAQFNPQDNNFWTALALIAATKTMHVCTSKRNLTFIQAVTTQTE